MQMGSWLSVTGCHRSSLSEQFLALLSSMYAACYAVRQDATVDVAL